MGVKYLLERTGNKMGLNPEQLSEREVLLGFINEAAEELYAQSDMPGSVMEQVFKVNGDQTISCPSYVGEIRAAREYDSQIAWHINQMRPRYNQFSWKDAFRNLRLKNRQALMATVVNQSVGVFTVSVIETPPIVVTISGPTASATMTSEEVTISELSVQTVNQYLDYVSVTKDRINDCDVTLSDVDGTVLTIIPNNQLEASYQIVDVSLCPWLSVGTNPLEHYLELLYKKALPILFNDSDEFPAQNYDNIIVNKVLQLWAEEQEKEKTALMYDAKATRSLARKTENINRATEDEVALVANPHDQVLPRIRQGRRVRQYYY